MSGFQPRGITRGLHIVSTASSVGLKNISQVDTSLDSPNTPSDRRHLVGIDWDQRTRKRGVYQIVGKGHEGWSPNVDQELGNYDYLLGADVGLFVTSSTDHG